MLREELYKHLILALIVIGGILRIAVFLVSPPNNAYDDHLEVVNIYAQDFNRPAPFQCWQCYQPPLYYSAGAIVYNIVNGLGGNNAISWKAVQGINPLLSILMLIIAYKILLLLKLRKPLIAIILSFLVALPRDIFTSAMLGNDYLLAFFSVLSFFLFLKTLAALKSGSAIWCWLTALVLTATLGSLTKQHGLLLHLFPGGILLMLFKKTYCNILYWAIPIILVGALFSLSDEVWKYYVTGNFLVSNQHYFDYAENQYPGSIDQVEFLNFRILRLYQEPFISEKTSASIFTQLFARTFYDYEWRFISPKSPWARSLGQIGYSIGLIWMLYYSFILISWIKQTKKKALKNGLFIMKSKFIPTVVTLFFVTVPFLQTLRFPYFSSMKAVFILSALIISILTIGSLIKDRSLAQRIGGGLIVLNITYAILLVVHISLYLGNSLNHLHGPLWPIP